MIRSNSFVVPHRTRSYQGPRPTDIVGYAPPAFDTRRGIVRQIGKVKVGVRIDVVIGSTQFVLRHKGNFKVPATRVVTIEVTKLLENGEVEGKAITGIRSEIGTIITAPLTSMCL